MEEVLDDNPNFRKMDTLVEEEVKGLDFGEVPLDQKNSTKNQLEDDNFDF